jgi:hypothetical protein
MPPGVVIGGMDGLGWELQQEQRCQIDNGE